MWYQYKLRKMGDNRHIVCKFRNVCWKNYNTNNVFRASHKNIRIAVKTWKLRYVDGGCRLLLRLARRLPSKKKLSFCVIEKCKCLFFEIFVRQIFWSTIRVFDRKNYYINHGNNICYFSYRILSAEIRITWNKIQWNIVHITNTKYVLYNIVVTYGLCSCFFSGH